jgi:hypothetical protein
VNSYDFKDVLLPLGSADGIALVFVATIPQANAASAERLVLAEG